MDLDDELCLCFHVSKRKVVNFVRIHKPQVASQITECGGAGTGCGWCRPFLKRIFEASKAGQTDDLPTAECYAESRSRYIADGKGTPPRQEPG